MTASISLGDIRIFRSIFQMNPGKTYLAEEEYEEMIRRIKENL